MTSKRTSKSWYSRNSIGASQSTPPEDEFIDNATGESIEPIIDSQTQSISNETSMCSSDSTERNYVREMAKRFEQINDIQSIDHVTNFKECNWWLKTPSSVTCLNEIDPNKMIVINNFDASEIDSAEEESKTDENTKRDSSLCASSSCEIPTASIVEAKNPILFLSPTSMIENSSDDDESQYHSLPPDDVFTDSNHMNSNLRPISLTSTISQISTTSATSSTSVNSTNSATSITSNQVTNTLEELLFNEETYIRSLNYGVDGYMKRFDQKNMPADLRGQKYRVFGNMHRIRDFHELEFFPALMQCNTNIVKICNTFCDFIEKDYFYIYTLYAINRQRSEKLCEMHRDYFKSIQSEIGDKLGVNSFLVQPIQRLPKYKLLLSQLISELGKRLEEDGVKEKIAACCLAEKRVQRLLDTVNGSMNLNDIVECNDINLRHQGKFLKVSEFDIVEYLTKRKFKGKVFLFDKCVIYTESLNKHKLIYRGYFCHETLGFTFEDGKNNFSLYVRKKGCHEIEFTSDSQTIQLWIQLLSKVLMSTVVLVEKKKIEENRRRFSSKSDLGPLHLLLRLNSPSLQDASSTSSSSNSSEITNRTSSSSAKSNTLDIFNRDSASNKSISSNQKHDSPNQTTWDERKLIERFLNSEKYYIQLLNKTIDTYLTNIPDDLQLTIFLYLGAIKDIVKFHTNIFYPKLQQCDGKVASICDLIKIHIDAMDFIVYHTYAAYVSETQKLLENHLTNSDTEKQLNSNEFEIKLTHSLMLPIKHIENIANTLDGLLDDYKEKDLLTEDFKIVATVGIEVKKLHKLVTENYNLNASKGSGLLVRKFGLVIYSDEISIDASKFRLLILEKGLACVAIRISMKTKNEKFLDHRFHLPLSAVELHENDLYPKKLRISANYATHVNYTTSFSTTRKKKQFIELIRKQINKAKADAIE